MRNTHLGWVSYDNPLKMLLHWYIYENFMIKSIRILLLKTKICEQADYSVASTNQASTY